MMTKRNKYTKKHNNLNHNHKTRKIYKGGQEKEREKEETISPTSVSQEENIVPSSNPILTETESSPENVIESSPDNVIESTPEKVIESSSESSTESSPEKVIETSPESLPEKQIQDNSKSSLISSLFSQLTSQPSQTIPDSKEETSQNIDPELGTPVNGYYFPGLSNEPKPIKYSPVIASLSQGIQQSFNQIIYDTLQTLLTSLGTNIDWNDPNSLDQLNALMKDPVFNAKLQESLQLINQKIRPQIQNVANEIAVIGSDAGSKIAKNVSGSIVTAVADIPGVGDLMSLVQLGDAVATGVESANQIRDTINNFSEPIKQIQNELNSLQDVSTSILNTNPLEKIGEGVSKTISDTKQAAIESAVQSIPTYELPDKDNLERKIKQTGGRVIKSLKNINKKYKLCNRYLMNRTIRIKK